jgi:hypothetical protein
MPKTKFVEECKSYIQPRKRTKTEDPGNDHESSTEEYSDRLKKAKAKLDRKYETFCRMVRKVKHRKHELDAAFQADTKHMGGEVRALEHELEELSAFQPYLLENSQSLQEAWQELETSVRNKRQRIKQENSVIDLTMADDSIKTEFQASSKYINTRRVSPSSSHTESCQEHSSIPHAASNKTSTKKFRESLIARTEPEENQSVRSARRQPTRPVARIEEPEEEQHAALAVASAVGNRFEQSVARRDHSGEPKASDESSITGNFASPAEQESELRRLRMPRLSWREIASQDLEELPPTEENEKSDDKNGNIVPLGVLVERYSMSCFKIPLPHSLGRPRRAMNLLLFGKHGIFGKFGQSAFCTKNGNISQLVLTSDWNKFAKRRTERQEIYVGTGSTREAYAEILAQTSTSFPLFLDPKEKTCIYYVGHWKSVQSTVHRLNPPISFYGRSPIHVY